MSEQYLRARQMSLDLSSPNHIPLNARIAEFRQDPQNMDQMIEFVDDIIKNAQIEANRRIEDNNKVNPKKLDFFFLYFKSIILTIHFVYISD